MKKRKTRRYQEGGDIPDIDREPLRDSQGNIVRSGIDTFTERFNINRGISPSDKGEPVMSGSTRDRGYGEAVALGRRMREERDALLALPLWTKLCFADLLNKRQRQRQ
jgi:hypothetical protein